MSKMFAKEVDLCAAFLAEVDRRKSDRRSQGKWTAYAETAGFDIVLVRDEDGAQIGIEAKLALNSTVILQALEGSRGWSAGVCGPDYRAVLVPNDATRSLSPLCGAIGLTVIACEKASQYRRGVGWFTPSLPAIGSDFYEEDWHEWCPVERLALPEYVPDVQAGAPSPLRVTQWKIKAIKLVILLADRPVTRADFRHLSLDPSRWTDPAFQWLVPAVNRGGYVAGRGLPDFKAQHPRVFEEILAAKEKWAPKSQKGALL